MEQPRYVGLTYAFATSGRSSALAELEIPWTAQDDIDTSIWQIITFIMIIVTKQYNPLSY